MGIISDAERCARQKYDFPPLSKSLYHPREALLFEGSGKTVLTGQLQQIDQAVYPAHPSKLEGVVGKMEKAQNQTYRHTGKKERKSPKTSTKGCPQKCLSRYKNLSLALSLLPFFFSFSYFSCLHLFYFLARRHFQLVGVKWSSTRYNPLQYAKSVATVSSEDNTVKSEAFPY